MMRAAGEDRPQAGSIESISHEALVKWTKDRRDYETKLHNRCRKTGEDYDAVVEQIRGSFDADLLDVFCELQLSSIKNKVLPVKELMKSDHKINLTESDVNTRVIDYFKCFKTIVADNGLVECFGGERGTREKSKRLISALIVDKATELERQYLGLKLQKRETTGRETKSKAKLPQKTKNKLEAPAVKMTAKTDKNKGNARSDSRTKTLCSTKPPPGPCPKCQEMHWLGECPATSESEKEELLKRFRNARKAKKAKLKRIGEFLPTATVPWC
ncbi:hypothetical protein L914_01946 [Phytophthora nicotianae]|uniref:Uncharacterized protein n=1 Tax=Phytophthora nicotianae TaxID=4792 RepID=W2P1D0_PHYNI|nr:hypothetical protein L914_01946 [Phytophthora nicotianae]